MTATLDNVLARYPGAQTFCFGDGPVLCDTLLELVRSGTKTATCGRLSDFSPGGTERPVPGRRDIATLWDGTPAVVIETVEVTERRFRDVDAAFARAEGAIGGLDGWRRDHRGFFERSGGWSDDMWLLCERFRAVEIIA